MWNYLHWDFGTGKSNPVHLRGSQLTLQNESEWWLRAQWKRKVMSLKARFGEPRWPTPGCARADWPSRPARSSGSARFGKRSHSRRRLVTTGPGSCRSAAPPALCAPRTQPLSGREPLCALQPAGLVAPAFSPRAQLVLTSARARERVGPCAGGSALCSSYFAWRESRLRSSPLTPLAPRPRPPLQREARWVFAPQERTRGASPALCFPGGLEDQSWRGARGIAQGAGGFLSRILGRSDFSQSWWKSPSRPGTCNLFWCLRSLACEGPTSKFSLPSLEKLWVPSIRLPRAVAARPACCAVSG